MAAQHQLQPHACEHHGAAACGQAVEAIGEVGGVAFGHKHKQPQRPDQQTDRQHPAQGQGDVAGGGPTQPLACCGPDQKQQGRAGLEQQFAPGCEARVGDSGEAAPVIDGADRHVGQGYGGNSKQAGIAWAQQAPHQHPHGHH